MLDWWFVWLPGVAIAAYLLGGLITARAAVRSTDKRVREAYQWGDQWKHEADSAAETKEKYRLLLQRAGCVLWLLEGSDDPAKKMSVDILNGDHPVVDPGDPLIMWRD